MLHGQFSDQFIIKQLDKQIALFEKQIDDISQAMEELLAADQPLKDGIDRLVAIKGLGLLSVTTLVAETNGFTGFDRPGAPECSSASELRGL